MPPENPLYRSGHYIDQAIALTTGAFRKRPCGPLSNRLILQHRKPEVLCFPKTLVSRICGERVIPSGRR